MDVKTKVLGKRQMTASLIGLAMSLWYCANAIAGPGDSQNKMEGVTNKATSKSVTALATGTAGIGPIKVGFDRAASVEFGSVINNAGQMKGVTNNANVTAVQAINSSAVVGVVKQGK